MSRDDDILLMLVTSCAVEMPVLPMSDAADPLLSAVNCSSVTEGTHLFITGVYGTNTG